MKKRILIALLSSLIFSAPVFSEQAKPQAEPPSPLYVHIMKLWSNTTNFPADSADLIVTKLQQGIENDPELKGALKPGFVADLQQFIYELLYSKESLEKLASIYSQYFTIDEMQELISFYKTPLGQKLVKAEPELIIKTQEVGMQLLKNHQKSYMELIAKHLKKGQVPQNNNAS